MDGPIETVRQGMDALDDVNERKVDQVVVELKKM